MKINIEEFKTVLKKATINNITKTIWYFKKGSKNDIKTHREN